MTVYVKTSPSDDGSVKFYCPVKSENFLFILKFKMKICDSKPVPLSSYPAGASSRTGYAADAPIGMSNTTNMNPGHSMEGTPVVRHSMEIEPKMSYQEPPPPAMFPNSNSNPNLFVSNPIYDRPLHDGKKRGKQKHDFEISQEFHELKKTKKNINPFEEEDASSLYIPHDLKDSSRMSSLKDSNENSMNFMVEREPSPPRNQPKQVIKQVKKEKEIPQKAQPAPVQKQNGNTRGQFKQAEKREVEREMESVSRPIQLNEKKNIFDLGSRIVGFKGNELSNFSI